MSDAKKELIRMIATWHELLAACEKAHAFINPDHDLARVVRDVLEAAIRRAKGEVGG